MNDPIDSVRVAYRNLILAGGIGVENVYDDIAPEDAAYPYVILSTQSALPVRLKDCHYFRSLIQIRIVTAYSASRVGSRMDAGAIASGIIGIVSPDALTVDGFRIIDNNLNINLSLPPYTNGQYTVRERVMQYEDLLEDQS